MNCCVTSPPYYGLRDYGVKGQLGLEKTPKEYVTRLTEVFAEVNRVLKKDGTLWLNISDSYAGSGKGAAAYPENTKKYKQGTSHGMVGAVATTQVKTPGLKPKDMIGIPWMLAFALRDSDWFLRQDIIWSKGNPMPESVKDRCTRSHEYIFLLSKSRKYYFDHEAIKEPAKYPFDKRGERKDSRRGSSMNSMSGSTGEFRNKRDVWMVNTKPYKEAHFATYPDTLIEPCILAGCPEGGTVLDPFIGSGTTAMVANRNSRSCIGIELNESYKELIEKRTDGANNKYISLQEK